LANEQKFQTSSKEEALSVLKNGVAKIESFQALCTSAFAYPSMSSASQEFASMSVEASNVKVNASVSTAMDLMDAVSKDLQAVENFLHLHIPKMEDGNNFGVTVQLALLKQIADLQEAIGKNTETLSGYAGSRADALDKLKLPSASTTTTKSTSSTTTDDKTEKKTSESKEEKLVDGNPTSIAHAARLSALVSVDGLYYSKALRAAQSTLGMYVAVLDFFDKNQDKLTQPKGSAGARSAYSGMY